MNPFNEDQMFKPKKHETVYQIFEKKPDGEEKELEVVTNTHPLSSEEKFRELTKVCKKLFPGVKFQSQASPKLGLHLINTESKSVFFIKQKN